MKKNLIFVIVLFTISVLYGQTIVNIDKPLKGKWDLQLKKIWEIEGTGTKDFGRIQNVAVSDDGRIFILDNKLKKVLIFNKDGKFLSEFGELGEGPGEFKMFRMGEQIYILKDDLIFVDRGRIHYFSLDGKFKKTVKTPDVIKARGFISRDVLVSAPVMIRDSGQKVEEIKSYNLVSKKESVISTFKPFEKASASGGSAGNRIRVGIIIGGITPLMNVTVRNNNLYYGMSNNYNITKRDLTTKKEINFQIKERKQKNISKKFFDDFSKRLKQIPPDMKKRILDGLPRKASFFQRIHVEENGLVYVFIADPDNDSMQAIDIFSKEGKYLYSTNIDIGEDNDLGNIEFTGNNLIISFEDDEGEIRLAKYQISKPKL